VLRSLTNPALLNPSIDLLHDIFTAPSFPQPAAVASKTFFQKLYGQRPYAHAILGTAKTVAHLTQGKLLSFYHQYYCAKNAKLILVGDIDRKQAETLAERIFEGMPQGGQATALEPAPQVDKRRQNAVSFPSRQSHVVIGQVGMSRKDKDYFSLIVGNHILGGGPLTSRLFRKVRDDEGLAYSVYSFFNRLKAKGPFLIKLQTRHDKATEAVGSVREILKQFVEKGPLPKEVDAAKKHITGRFLVDLASNAAVTSYVATIAINDLPLNYLDTFRPQVEAVTQKEIQQAFKDRIHPDQMLTVIVGQQ